MQGAKYLFSFLNTTFYILLEAISVRENIPEIAECFHIFQFASVYPNVTMSSINPHYFGFCRINSSIFAAYSRICSNLAVICICERRHIVHVIEVLQPSMDTPCNPSFFFYYAAHITESKTTLSNNGNITHPCLIPVFTCSLSLNNISCNIQHSAFSYTRLINEISF